jgi:hypothetical protein
VLVTWKRDDGEATSPSIAASAEGTVAVSLAGTSRLLLAACSGDGHPDSSGPGILPPVVLAFAAGAAHVNGEEEEERSYTAALLEPARAAGAERPLLPAAWDVLT